MNKVGSRFNNSDSRRKAYIIENDCDVLQYRNWMIRVCNIQLYSFARDSLTINN